MIREEEKEKAARRYATHDVDTDETDFYGNYIKKEDFVLPEYNAFLEGCKWSDLNSKSPWISVRDDLPCDHNELIHGNEKNAWTVSCIVSDGICTTTNRMFLVEGEWIWGIGFTNVKYWFVIPELPKE